MTSFTVVAQPFGRRVKLTWIDGELTGNRQVVDVVKSQAERYEGRYLMTPKGATRYDHLKNPYATLALIRMALGDTVRITEGSLDE